MSSLIVVAEVELARGPTTIDKPPSSSWGPFKGIAEAGWSKKAGQDKHSQLLISWEVHRVKSLAKSLSDEELEVKAAWEAQ